MKKALLVSLLALESGFAAGHTTIYDAVTAGDFEAVKRIISENPIEISQQVNQPRGH